jgi:YD repeat-containing protein
MTAYDRNGDVLSVNRCAGRVSTNVYDARGLLSSSTDASRTIAYEYDAVGRVLKRREDPNG